MSKSYDGHVRLSTKLDTSGIEKGAQSMKSALTKTSKAILAIGAASAAAIAAVTKKAVDSYAEYEQLAGGVETLFKNSADKVKAYAENAYYTAGASANEYMSTVTSFSASLISSLGGDTEKAADVANMAMVDMSDNANKMGTPLESIRTAYQGFAKQQYQLLDNLKLGYGGTKTEMERLLKDAEEFSGVKYDINNLGDVYEAIHQIQKKLDITGTTAKEAEKTIAGSATMMKASWNNLLTAIAGGGNLDRAINNMVYSMEKYMENILPVVERSLVGIGYAVERIAPLLVERIAIALVKAIPSLLNAIYQMIIGLAKGVYQGIKSLFTGGTTEVLEKQLAQISDSVDKQNELTDAVEETEKAVKKSLAGFDELNILSDQNADAGDAAADSIIPSAGASADAGSSEDIGVQSKVEAAVVWVGLALLALGAVLAFSGINIPLGIGLMAAGAVAVGTAAATNWSAVEEALSGPIGTAIALTSIVLLVLGAILAFSGASIGLGIGLMVAGAAGITAVAVVNWDSIVEAMRGPIGAVVAIVSGALLVIGAILAFTGVGIPLGIGLMVAGAAGLAAVVAINWDSIKQPILDVISGIMAILGGAMLVLGVLLCLTGAGIPVGLALILGAVGLTAGASKLSDNPITRFVKDMVNSVLGLINMLIEGINELFHIKFDGLNIGGVQVVPKMDFRLLKIPPIPLLAKGAVIPPNAPFMAMLGDQRHGTNIEAPLSTIQEAVAEVMADYEASNLAGHEATVEVLRQLLSAVLGIEIGDTTIGQAANRYNRRMAITTGGV